MFYTLKLAFSAFILVFYTLPATAQDRPAVVQTSLPHFVSASDPLDLILAKMIRMGELCQSMGQLAQTKGQAEPVKRFGFRLDHDHKLLNRRLKEYSRNQGLILELENLKSPKLSQLEKLVGDLQQAPHFDLLFTGILLSHLPEINSSMRVLKEHSSQHDLASLIESHIAILSQHLELAQYLEAHNPQL